MVFNRLLGNGWSDLDDFFSADPMKFRFWWNAEKNQSSSMICHSLSLDTSLAWVMDKSVWFKLNNFWKQGGPSVQLRKLKFEDALAMVLSASPKIKLSQFDYCKISKKNRGCLCFVFYLQIIRSRLLATWHVIQWANFQTLHFYCPKVAARIFLILISIHCWAGHSSCLESLYREWGTCG